MRRAPLILALWLAGSPALAQETPRALSGRYSAYEEEALEAAEGKLVEAIVIRRLLPIEPRDPVPGALNALHVESRESVIAREVLLVQGARFSRALCDESARRLRTLPQLSLVLCAPLRGSAPGRVKVLILTKDIWSLLLDPDFDTSGGQLLLEPKEQNLLGLHHTAFLRYWHDPRSYSLGGDYRIPRLDGRFLSLLADANVFVNRATGKLEGSYGALQAQGLPASARDPWAWFIDLGWRQEHARRYNVEVVRVLPDDGPDAMDFEWHHQEVYGVAAVTRSWGWRYKTDATLALSGTRLSDRRLDAQRNWDDIAAAETLDQQMIPSYRRVGPLAELHLYTSDFLRTFEVETLGLQEDFRLGHDLLFGVSPAWRATQSDNRLGPYHAVLGASATAQETLAFADGFARIGVQGGADVRPEKTDAGFVKGWLRAVTPRLGVGRLVLDAEGTLALDDSQLRAPPSYGNSNRLRGSANVAAASAAVVNIEYRTPALELWTEQLGAVLFFDAAHFEPRHGGQIENKSSVGAGLRLVTPMLERSGLRFDVAVPLDSHGADFGGLMTQLTFGQAFGVPDVSPLKPRRLK